jgi:long-subunit fatty acid transport protein
MGHLRNIELKMPTGWTRADLIMSGIASQYATGASTATNVATQTTALVNGGAGSLTLAQAEAATIITADQRQLLETALEGFGLETTGTISEADAGLKGKAQEFTAYSAQYTATASLLGDQEADVEQTGYGITPFFSVNISPTDRINIGIKYEMATEMTITNKTAKDFKVGYTPTGTAITMFPDGEEIRNDMPAMLSMGVDLGLTEKLNVAAGFHYYFDKPANYGRKLNGVYVENEKIIDNNYYEAAAGLQYKLNDYLLLSAGYLYSKTGVNDDYQSDLTYSLTSHTGGIGGAINVLDNLRINLGFAYTYYLNGEKTINHLFSPTATTITAKETYYKDTMIISAGIDFNF